jgi:hypothetical protein
MTSFWATYLSFPRRREPRPGMRRLVLFGLNSKDCLGLGPRLRGDDIVGVSAMWLRRLGY